MFNRPKHTQDAYWREFWQFKDFVKKPLPQMTLEDLQAYEASLTHLAHASRNRALAAIKSALSFALELNYCKTNVGLLLHLRRPEETIAERIMSDHAVDDMIRLETNPRNHALLTLLCYAGLRVSEACNLTWRNLQERDEAGQIAVYGKGDKTRYILLDTDTWWEVWNLRGSAPLDAYVFQSRQMRSRADKETRRLDESTVHRIVRTAADRAGIAMGKVSPHWLRHANATHSLEAGAPLALVQQTLGHASIETTAKYTHIRPTASSAVYLRKKRSSH